MVKKENGEMETALVRVKPELDNSVILLYQESCRLLDFAQVRIIRADDDVKAATDDLSIIARLKKAIEEKRRGYTGPINDHLKAVNAAFQEFTAPLTEADIITRQKVKDYRVEQERIRQEQERINRLRMEAAEAEMKLRDELTEPVDLVEVAPAPAEHYRTESGTLGTMKVRKWEVENLDLIPREYLMIDATKIGKVVRAGIPSISGIRIWEEESLRVTTK